MQVRLTPDRSGRWTLSLGAFTWIGSRGEIEALAHLFALVDAVDFYAGPDAALEALLARLQRRGALN